MKSIKIVTTSVVFIILVLVISSFAKNYDRYAFARICYEFIGSNPSTPTVAELQNPNNWIEYLVAPSEATIEIFNCPQASKLCNICIDNSNTSFAEATAILGAFIAGGGIIAALPDPTTLTNASGKSVKVFQYN